MPSFRDGLIALALAIAVLFVGTAPGRAQSYEAALAGFTTDSFRDTEKAINDVAASGHARAADVIGALQDGRLLFDPGSKKVYVRDRAGTMLDAATGAPVGAAPADLNPVRLNNRLRRAVEAALGSLTLLAPDPARRLEAAQAVFRSRDAAALPTLETALGKETDARVKRALAQARAAVILNKPDAKEAEALDAVAVIRDRGDQDALGLLSALPAEAPGEVKKAAADAVGWIEGRLALWNTAQNAWYGLSLGSVLLLAAIGLAITFGVMGVINMAHGEMVMLGAYTTFVVQELIRAHNPALFDYSLIIAVPLAFLVAGGGRHPGRARHHPLPLRPSARDPARDLGPLADPAAGGAHGIRGDQPRGRRALLDERCVRTGRAHHHLQPAVDHRLCARGVRAVCSPCCDSRASASKCAP